MVRNTENGSGHFLHSKEGLTQGDPVAMITYGIGVLPLIFDLKRDHPRVTQPWYADDAGAGGGFGDIMAHFRDFQLRGPARGTFFLATTKMLLVGSGNYPQAGPLSWRSLKWSIMSPNPPPAPASSAYHACVTQGWYLLR